ncbi:hypothetical protein LUZ62_068118 [Rhynchospora pubera]|uniref:RNase H type-1 domain-containing protein n=1 Tax=Rhynchospora pubera TaxID=906938 RepID=A0AAV8CRV7_9POAL|nr:hypothetical protein LUZ62_068118 [Rhynchospora pubera]
MIRNGLTSSIRIYCISRQSVYLSTRYSHHNAEPPKWKKPERGCVKLNFDGSSRTKKASIGGVYRNHEGAFLLGYSERIEKATSCVAELIAVKRGLELALENGWLNVWIEGDAKFVVDLLLKPTRVKSKEHVKHASEIRMLASLLDHFDASHISRKGNKVADKLAKLGYDINKPTIWSDVPTADVARLLCDDAADN